MNEQLSFLELLKFLNEIMRKIERNSLCQSATVRGQAAAMQQLRRRWPPAVFASLPA